MSCLNCSNSSDNTSMSCLNFFIRLSSTQTLIRRIKKEINVDIKRNGIINSSSLMLFNDLNQIGVISRDVRQ